MRNRGRPHSVLIPRAHRAGIGAEKDRLLVQLELTVTRLRAENEVLQEAKAELEGKRDRWAFFYERSPVGYVTFDEKGNIRELNDAAATLLGRTRPKLLNTPFTFLVSNESSPAFLKHLNRCRENPSERVVSEMSLRKKGNKEVIVQLVSVAFDQAGSRLFQTAIIDLTEAKKNEASVKESKEFAESIVDTIREPLLILDSDLKVVSVNRAFTQVFKKSNLTAKGQLFDVLLNLWWSGNQVRTELDRVLIKKTTLDDFELVVDPKGLGKRTLLLNARPLVRKESPSTQILIALQDITEEKEAQEKLKQSETLLAEAQRLAHVGSWQWDTTNDLVTWSEELYRIFDVAPGALKTDYSGYLQCVHEEDRPRVDAVIQHAYRNRLSFKFDHRTASINKPRILQCHGYVVCDDIGKVLRLVGTAQDVTEIKEAEARLKSLNDELEERVKVRTQALRQSNREMEAFCYSIAHDLRSPLRAMKGFSFALLEDYAAKVDTEGKEYLERIVSSADRMDRLIQDLLDYGRLNTVNLPIDEVDAEEVLRDVLGQYEADIKKQKATIVHEGRLPKVYAHPLVLQMALANIIGNALKFVAPGVAPRVEVGAEVCGNEIRIWVQDNGIGIAPQYQKRIFEVFQRLHATQAYPGTGIGLAIVAKGIERIGGRVGLESEPEHGSRFWIELPRAIAEGQEQK